MILRKPYAFLIKHFKIIHLILTGFVIYLVTIINGMLNYFNDFINGTVGKLGAYDLVNSLYGYIAVLAIIICLIIIALMKYKKKSYLFYIILIGYFLAISVIINFSMKGLYTIYISSLDMKSLLLYRDILKIVNIVQYIFVVMTLVRGLGFDIKKFNFVDDLVDLDIDIDDDEEVELTVGGLEGSKRKFNRNIREFKYYYLENKQMINLILIVIVVIGLSCYLVNNYIFNPVYKVNDTFEFEQFSFKVVNSYVTNIGYDNMKVDSDDTTFVLINMDIINNGSRKEVNTANFVLEIEDYKYSNHIITNKFLDLGTVYKNREIEDSARYMFIFKIPTKNYRKNMKLVLGNDKKVNLTPIFLDEIDEVKKYKLGDSINLSNSFYGNGEVKMISYEINKSFDYKYTYEVLEKEYEGNITISSVNNIILNLVMSGRYPSGYNNYSFLKKYAKLKYKVGDKEYISNVFDDKTPISYKKGLYLGVDKELENADSIWFDITVRNKQYIYKLK